MARHKFRNTPCRKPTRPRYLLFRIQRRKRPIPLPRPRRSVARACYLWWRQMQRDTRGEEERTSIHEEGSCFSWAEADGFGMRAKVLNEPADYAKIARAASIPSEGEANTRETSAPRSGNQFFALSNLATDHVAGRTSFVGATTCLVAARTKLVAGRTCLVAGRTSFVGGTTCHVATRTCHVAGRTNLVVATTKLVATRTKSKFRRKRSGNRPNLIVFDSCRFSQAGVPG